MSRLTLPLQIDALTEQVQRVSDDRDQLQRDIALRDDLIRELHTEGFPYRMLIKLTGLSRDRLYTIVNSPSISPTEA